MGQHRGLAATYRSARERFRTAAESAEAAGSSHPFPDRGPRGEELAIDVVRLGPADARSVVVVVSGTHGVEGFAGSMCQSGWLEDHRPGSLPGHLAVLLVHAHNPFGFAWVRRVNEDNVDINRNYLPDHLHHPPTNTGYEELAHALAPADLTEQTLAAADAVLLDYGARHGFPALQAAISGGQYTHPDGLFYGGLVPSLSQTAMRALLTTRLADAERVAVLDLHTGLGEWAEVELITHEVPGSPAFERSRRWWGDRVASNTAGESVSAALEGEWMPAAQRWLAPREVTTVALEWGTVDQLTVLRALRADNWLHHHGDPTAAEAAPVKAQLRAAFAPDDLEWCARVEDRFRQVLADTVEALT